MRRSTTLFLLLHATLSLAAPDEFHVSPNGEDANRGTEAKPFATLERARDGARGRRAEGGDLKPEGGEGPAFVLRHYGVASKGQEEDSRFGIRGQVGGKS